MEEQTQENIKNETIIAEKVINVSTDKKMDSISDLLKSTFDLYKKNVWRLVAIVALPILFIILAMLAIILGTMFLPSMIAISVMVFLAGVLIIISVWSKSALLFAIKNINEKMSFKQVFERSQKFIWPYFVISVLVGFIILGGLTFLFIPAVILGVMVMFSNFVLIDQNHKDIDALAKSREYIRGYWWQVFARMVVVFLIFMIISTIPLIGNIVSIFFATPFIMIYVFKMYENLKEIKSTEVVTDNKDTKDMMVLIAVIGIFIALFFIKFMGKISQNNEKRMHTNSYMNDFDKGYKNNRKMYEKSPFGKYYKHM